jgi:predicted ThiF/HesA family dinucleotide-utilizing enzyme
MPRYQVLVRYENGKGEYDIHYLKALTKKQAYRKAYRHAAKENLKVIDMDKMEKNDVVYIVLGGSNNEK